MEKAKFILYAHGNIVEGNDGYCYDKRPVAVVSVSRDSTYEQVVDIICKRLKVNRSTHRVELYHRVSIGDKTLRYDIVPVTDDDAAQEMLVYTEGSVAVYVQIFKNELPPVPPCDMGIDGNVGSQGFAGSNTTPVQPVVGSQVQVQGNNVEISMPGWIGGDDTDGTEDSPASESSDDYDDERNNSVVGLSQQVPDTDVQRRGNDWHRFVAPTDVDAVGSSVPVPFFTAEVGSAHAIFDDEHEMSAGNWSFSDEFKVGMRFDTKDHLIRAVKMWHIKNHYNFKVVDSDPRSWAVKCTDTHNRGCRWRLRGSYKKHGGWFHITKYEGPHTCLDELTGQDHCQLDSTSMSRCIILEIRNSPDVRAKHLQSNILKEFGYNVHIRRIREAKRKAIEQVYGSWEGSYVELPHLLNAIVEANPGTMVEWNTIESDTAGHVFLDKLFWAFGPCIEAFQYCRYVICTLMQMSFKAYSF